MAVNYLSGGLRMAPDRAQALQDTFLDHLRKHEVPVTMFLTNGVRLQGYVGGSTAIPSCSFGTGRCNWSTSTRSPPSCPESPYRWSGQTSNSVLRSDTVAHWHRSVVPLGGLRTFSVSPNRLQGQGALA